MSGGYPAGSRGPSGGYSAGPDHSGGYSAGSKSKRESEQSARFTEGLSRLPASFRCSCIVHVVMLARTRCDRRISVGSRGRNPALVGGLRPFIPAAQSRQPLIQRHLHSLPSFVPCLHCSALPLPVLHLPFGCALSLCIIYPFSREIGRDGPSPASTGYQP